MPDVGLTTALKGEFALLRTQQVALEKGWIASRPTRDCRYDLILDDGKRLHRVQVKYAGRKAPHATGAVLLDLTKGGKRDRTYLDHEIDAVLAYVAPADAIAWLGPDSFHNRRWVSIRYEPTRNNQKARVLLLSDVSW